MPPRLSDEQPAQGSSCLELTLGIPYGVVTRPVDLESLAVAEVGVAWRSVWFWQVAGFSFSHVFSHEWELLSDP